MRSISAYSYTVAVGKVDGETGCGTMKWTVLGWDSVQWRWFL